MATTHQGVSAEVTPWFPARVKPVHVSVYPVKLFFGGDEFAYWNGSRWGLVFDTAKKANRYRVSDLASQNKEWRGLTHNPAETVEQVLESARHQPVEV